MATYARVHDGSVAELFITKSPIAALFPPGLTWVDVTATPQVGVGWLSQASGFAAPPQAAVASGITPSVSATLAVVQAQLTALQTQLSRISANLGSNA